MPFRGVNSLAGPLHGLANQETLIWLLDVYKKLGGVPTASSCAVRLGHAQRGQVSLDMGTLYYANPIRVLLPSSNTPKSLCLMTRSSSLPGW
jgi:hypothetical protein